MLGTGPYIIGICILAYVIFIQSNTGTPVLPQPSSGYIFRPNETQKLVEEAKREAARVQAIQQQRHSLQGKDGQLVEYAYDVALKDGDEYLQDIIDYVHHRNAEHQMSAAVREAETRVHETLVADQPPVKVHVILAADNGTFSGMHELYFIEAALRYRTDLSIRHCRSASFGFFEKPRRDPLTSRVLNGAGSSSAGVRKVPMLVVTTGILPTSSAACTEAVMQLPMFAVQSVTLLGTSGGTPVVGGGGWHPGVPQATAETSIRSDMSVEEQEMRANPTCQLPWKDEATKVAIGSVCVTYGSLLQECGHCVEAEEAVTSLCSRPRCSMHQNTSFFGPCGFLHPISSFAESMKAYMYGQSFPEVPHAVQNGMRAFWEANEAVKEYILKPEMEKLLKTTAQDPADILLHYNRVAPTKPILLNCAEVVTSQILAGPRSDALCREYTEQLFEGRYAAKDVTCIQAMEGTGVLHVLKQNYPSVPAAIVRAVSNYDMYPLTQQQYRIDKSGAGEEGGELTYVSWTQNEHYLPPAELQEFTKASFRYAVEMASAVVLNYFLSSDTVLPGDKN